MFKNNSSNQVLFIDWGTTNFRAYKFDLIKNKITKKIKQNKGILNLKNKSEYIQILNAILLKFNFKEKPFILMSGMVGSKKGLFEAKYVSIPSTIKTIASKITSKKISGIDINIIPGLFFKRNNMYDVLRGEETIVIGAIQKSKIKKQCYLCCPGTHSKWIMIKNDKIKNFSTYMSGELYSVISQQTILSQSLFTNNKTISRKFLRKGFEMIIKGKNINNILFMIRTMDIFNQNKTYERKSFLSGLLIGMEIFEISKQKDITKSKIILISGGTLTKIYSECLSYFKLKFELLNSDECFIQGIKKIYDSID